MNIKLRINGVITLLPKNISPEQLHKSLAPLAQSAELELPPIRIGHGYYLWTIDGEEWKKFSDLSKEEKSVWAELFKERKGRLKTLFAGSPMYESIMTIPSEEFIYVRNHGNKREIALTAWGYKYPNKAPIIDLDTWMDFTEKEQVNIGFLWGDEIIPRVPFTLATEHRMTNEKGWFVCDGKLPVGNTYRVTTLPNKSFDLVVEKGKQDYIFDLTEKALVCIRIICDGAPVANAECEVMFGQTSQHITTGIDGEAHTDFILEHDEYASPLSPQPLCYAKYNDESQQDTPSADRPLLFVFEHTTNIAETEQKTENLEPETPIPSPSEEKEQTLEKRTVRLTLLDYGGNPLQSIPFTIKTKKQGTITLETDDEGHCEIPQEWFTDKEKIRIAFDVTPEYQQTHDIHKKKSKG